jgi:hypothetical protein
MSAKSLAGRRARQDRHRPAGAPCCSRPAIEAVLDDLHRWLTPATESRKGPGLACATRAARRLRGTRWWKWRALHGRTRSRGNDRVGIPAGMAASRSTMPGMANQD